MMRSHIFVKVAAVTLSLSLAGGYVAYRGLGTMRTLGHSPGSTGRADTGVASSTVSTREFMGGSKSMLIAGPNDMAEAPAIGESLRREHVEDPSEHPSAFEFDRDESPWMFAPPGSNMFSGTVVDLVRVERTMDAVTLMSSSKSGAVVSAGDLAIVGESFNPVSRSLFETRSGSAIFSGFAWSRLQSLPVLSQASPVRVSVYSSTTPTSQRALIGSSKLGIIAKPSDFSELSQRFSPQREAPRKGETP